MRRALAACVGVLVLAGCGHSGPPMQQPSSPPAAAGDAAAEPGQGGAQAPPAMPEPMVEGDIIEGLAAPWSVAVADDDSAFVSLRDDGMVRLLQRTGPGWAATGSWQVPGVDHSNEGGLMGLALAPTGDELYAMLTTARDNRVVRMPWDGRGLGEPEVVISGLPKAEVHNGGRIAFGPDGMLYVATGDAGDPDSAQDPAKLGGKILRLLPDGAVPADNPLPGSAVFSLGHRNVQGLAFDDSGALWASEFGAKDVDEINRITAGGNYGWPLVEGPGGGGGLIDPQATFSPTSVASPSGMAFAQGSLWVASLRGRTLYQVPIAGGAAQQPIAHFAGRFGRLRDVVNAPGGALWVLTNNTDGRGDPAPGDDRLIELRLVPDR